MLMLDLLKPELIFDGKQNEAEPLANRVITGNQGKCLSLL
jgi:hypothetical protein